MNEFTSKLSQWLTFLCDGLKKQKKTWRRAQFANRRGKSRNFPTATAPI